MQHNNGQSCIATVVFLISFLRLSQKPSATFYYPRDAMLALVFATATCLSVCLSVRHRYCVKTKKGSVMIFSPSGSPKTLVF